MPKKVEFNIVARTGNEAMAEAMRQINPDVVAAYPITPATEVVQLFASFVSDGLVDTEFVPVESEHSAISACVGAAAAGGRVITSTSSQGLALMHEILYIAAALRLPIVICEVNRALSGPINIHCDHSDTMGSRDAGWIQIFSENAQEAYDSIIQAIRIAEATRVPAMVTTDGFIISHEMQRLEMLPDKEVQDFVGEYHPKFSLLDVDNPILVGTFDLQDYFFEHKRAQSEGMNEAPKQIEKVAKEFKEKYGREYGMVEGYMVDDAELVVVVMGSAAGTTKAVVDSLREKGVKAGVLKIRVFRPFPFDDVVKILSDKKAVAVMDRADSLAGFGGPLFTDIRSALYDADGKPPMADYIFGLGGRDISMEEIKSIYDQLAKIAKTGKAVNLINYVGVRE
ncbi:pyruvate ferredoxin oxidoreductase [candidate division TA06 bacterium]|uniref:Pyruvate ferredoxin oxidoreductase n=1 Tax=candidate division TA06 bacterium TaxID=2250710 RepID=A0A523XWM1_UNCT6|nr:MAG: pyruvate ferredoxin oxidoreductase [candidate division TA06 bacterium]